MKKAYIFDLDGTLLNTMDDMVDSVNHCLEMHHFPQRSYEEIRIMVGSGMRNLISRAVPEGTDEEVFEKVFADYKEYYGSHCMVKTKPYPGIAEALGSLKKRGIKLAVLSNKSDVLTKAICSHYYPGVFDLVYGERVGINRKPDPTSLLMIVKELGLDAEDCVYIGDSNTDIQTAKNAGMDCISVTWGFRPYEFLKEKGAKVLISDPFELLRVEL